MAPSLVYRSAWGYELVMAALYGRHYAARYRAIAELIPRRSSVLELCCGPGILFDRYLRDKEVDYTGLDINPRFVARVNRKGGRGLLWDLREERPLPMADTIVMQASLYHFLPNAAPVIRRMKQASRHHVIIAEPIRNLTNSRIPLIAWLAAHQTDCGGGAEVSRFTESALDLLVDSELGPGCSSFYIPGAREKVYFWALDDPTCLRSARGPADATLAPNDRPASISFAYLH
jgi:SAM-dependent methyltransferase